MTTLYTLIRAYQLGWSTPEIAQAFRLPLTRVNTQLKAAGVQLRQRGGKRHFKLGALGKGWVR